MAVSEPLVRTEFVYEHAPFPAAHASTIVETRDGLVHVTYTRRRKRIKHVVIDPRHLHPHAG